MPIISVDLIADAVLLGFLGALAWVDLRQFRLPDALTLPLIVIGLGLALAGHGPPPLDAALGAVIGFAVFWTLGAVHFRLRRVEGLGMGDAKLLAAAGAWLGWQMLPWLVLAASLPALLFALLTRHGREDRIAFGLWLCLGFAGLRLAG
ncbi:A24 family peptidase [Marinovum sp.]|uniref:prepilin peptidase n=1 Tax=Marinovum sp. TaxID=2024839 RepID=UPI002B264B45|nr:A24 family peptidase [Marinovum sp.]